ncbi:MAG: EamA family transporter [Candidatus Omnitrophica bacterium]|nr:EamA family transporter [Candidatus Omnitrophota bacterium]
MLKNKLTVKILIFLIFSDILETFTQFCFKKGALNAVNLDVNNLAGLSVFFKIVFSSGFIWIGVLSVIFTFIIWSTILSKIELSVAVPIASFSYILVPLVSVFFLHEKISLLRWAGIVFILAGVIVVSKSSHERETA